MTDTGEQLTAVNLCTTEEEGKNITKQENKENEIQIKFETCDDSEVTADDESFTSLSRAELIELYKNSNTYISGLESKFANLEAELTSLKRSTDYQKQRDPSYREKVLMRKLTLKEQEIQDYIAQINELKAAQIPALATLKSTLLDPAINIIIQKLKNELNVTKASLEETQNELNAWKFTPDSNTGKRLMAKCRLLHQENEELGKMISSGRVAKLEGELALQKNFSEEVKKSQFELDELLQDLDEDVEGMQGTIYYLQQELKKSKEKLVDLETKNQELSNSLNRNVNFDKVSVEEEDNKPRIIVDKNDSAADFHTDESSNDSACLILKVNPEEEYESLLNEDTIKNEECDNDYKNKRSNDDNFRNIPLKKQKRSSTSKDYSD